MKKWRLDIQWGILYLCVWCILFERINIAILISGIIMSIASLYITEKYLMGSSYRIKYPLNFLWVIKYGFFLFIEIYKAGFKTIKMVFTNDINPGVVDIHTHLKSSPKVTILANSITLTPGTITIDKEDQNLKVLWLNIETHDPKEAGDLIKGNLEKHL